MKRALVLALAACSSGRAKAVEDARTAKLEPSPPRPAAGSAEVAAAPAPQGGVGDLQVRVEWHDVPAAVRAPGARTACKTARAPAARTACKTARAPAVAPTTTWGIPDALVVLGGERAKPAPEAPLRIVLDHCALSPRAAIAVSTLAVASTSIEPVKLALLRQSSLADLGKVGSPQTRSLELPTAGHEVDVALEAGVYTLAGADSNAWVVAAPNSYAAVTDASGAAVLRDLPVGTYAITAWLPPGGGFEGKLARGEAKVTAGALAEVTLDLGK